VVNRGQGLVIGSRPGELWRGQTTFDAQENTKN